MEDELMNEQPRGRFDGQSSNLQSVVHKAFADLSELWHGILDPAKSGAVSSEEMDPYFRVGQLLGQFRIDPVSLIEALRARLASLKEARISQQRIELGRCTTESVRIFDKELPDALEARTVTDQRLQKARADDPLRGWKGSRFEIAFYLLPSLFVLGAEVALAHQVTQEALLLQSPLYFSLALASLTLAFKFLSDRFFPDGNEEEHSGSKAGLAYLVVMLALFATLMWFVAALRTQKVVSDFADARSFSSGTVGWADLQTSPQPGSTPQPVVDPRTSPGATGTNSQDNLRKYSLQYAFYLSAILFPMLSGAGFSRAFRSLDVRAKHVRAQGTLQENKAALMTSEENYSQCLERLGHLRERAARAISALGPAAESLPGYIYRLISLVDDADARKELGKLAEAFLDNPSARGLSSLLSSVRSSLSPIEDDFVRNLQFEHLIGLSEVSLAAMSRRDLDLVAEELFGQLRGQIESGARYGRATGFEMFEGESRDKLLNVVDLKKYHSRFFDEALEDNESQTTT
jgi:hypothetical protein